MSESPLGDAAEVEQADEEIPELSGEPDNEPLEGVNAPDVDVQDPEGTERPERDKHPED